VGVGRPDDTFSELRVALCHLSLAELRNEVTRQELFDRFWSGQDVLETDNEDHGEPPHLIGQAELRVDDTESSVMNMDDEILVNQGKDKLS